MVWGRESPYLGPVTDTGVPDINLDQLEEAGSPHVTDEEIKA